jgi:hypothetical protein
MMWNYISFLLFLFLCQVVQEEVDKNSVDLRIWFELHDFATEELNSPYAAACSSC